MLSDPIADMLTRIRNASKVLKKEAIVGYSKNKHAIAKVLKKEGFLEKVGVRGKAQNKELVLKLKYKNKEPAIRTLKRISKPGRRIYQTYKNLPKVLSGYGIAVVSTSKGVMTAKEARKKKIGGEVICKVW